MPTAIESRGGANARKIATERSRECAPPEKSRGMSPNRTTAAMISVPMDQWQALLKRVSDIEAWAKRHTPAALSFGDRTDWESTQVDSMLDAEQARQKLSLADANQVRARAREGKIFGLLAPGRMRGTKFPAWQFHSAVIGEPLRQTLSALAELGLEGWAIHEFFEEPRVALHGLSAREVLLGAADSGEPKPKARALLQDTAKQRLARVLTAIEEYSHEP